MMMQQMMRRLRLAPDADFFSLLEWVGFLSAAIGYLLTIVTSQRLTLGLFALFTVINLLWFACFARLRRADGRLPMRLLLAAMLTLALAGFFCMPFGLSYDWLLPTVTLGVFALALTWRQAALAVVVVAVASIIAMLLAHGTWGNIANMLAQTMAAYVFVVIFSLVISRQRELREQAEELATAVSRANSELERAHAELRASASQAEELTISRERNRMAREIHDTLGHYLTILAVQLETALKLEQRGDPQLEATLRDARRVAAESLAEVRRSVAALRPGDVTGRSLGEALRRLASETEALSPEMDVTVDVEEPEIELEPELRAALYRCSQEALTNIRKHARATKALVRLRVSSPGVASAPAAREVELTVLDNGQSQGASGDAAAQQAPGFGLQGLHERIVLLGGTAQARPEPGRGWRVEVRVPLSVPATPTATPTSHDAIGQPATAPTANNRQPSAMGASDD